MLFLRHLLIRGIMELGLIAILFPQPGFWRNNISLMTSKDSLLLPHH